MPPGHIFLCLLKLLLIAFLSSYNVCMGVDTTLVTRRCTSVINTIARATVVKLQVLRSTSNQVRTLWDTKI